MEFGLDQLRTGLRPGSSRFGLSRHVEIARTCRDGPCCANKYNLFRTQTGSKLNSITLSWSQIWSQTCSYMEFGLSRTIYLASSELAGLRHVCDQPRTCLRRG